LIGQILGFDLIAVLLHRDLNGGLQNPASGLSSIQNTQVTQRGPTAGA